MRKLLAILSALLIAGPANANFDVTTGNGTHIFAIDGSNQGTSLCAAASTECPASVPVNTAGTPLFTASLPGQVGGAASAFADGWNITEGTKADSAYTSGSGSIVSILKGIFTNTGAAIPAGTNQIGFVGLQSNTTGGCTEAHFYMQGTSNNANLVSTGAHTLCGYRVDQLSTAAGFLRFYDSSGSPTCSSATGVKDAVPVQSNATSPGSSPNLGAYGEAFASGLAFCFTNAVGDTDNTNWAGTTNNVIVTVWYK